MLGHRAQLNESVVAQAAELHGHGVRVRTLTLFYDEWLGKLPVGDLERMSLMFDIQELHARRYARMKRMVDVVAAVVALGLMVFAVPLVILLDMAGNKGSIFFRQTRVGKGGTEFTIVKFRTMAASNTRSSVDQRGRSPIGRRRALDASSPSRRTAAGRQPFVGRSLLGGTPSRTTPLRG